jgi:drug/metabolite transporter (DMT)-like permease
MTGHPVWAAVAAGGAAAAYALTSILQHRGARAATPRHALDPRLLLQLLRNRLWLTGTAADVIGIGLHAIALGLGPLALVQPVVAGGILIAVPLDCVLDRRPLSRSALLGVLTGTAGLAGFVLAAAPSGGTDDPARPALAVALGCCLASLAGCLAIDRVTGRSWRGCLLGLAAGIAYAGSGSLVKVTVGLVGHGIGAVVLDWPPYALIGIGGLGLVLNQNAFQNRPLQPALVSMTLATPAASAVIGVLAFGEHLTGSRPRTLVAVIAAAAMVIGALVSTRSQAAGDTRRTPDGDRRTTAHRSESNPALHRNPD